MTTAVSAPGKSDAAFRSIGEAASELGLQTHVLRFWETKFSVLKPTKRRDGRRLYRPEDMSAARAIQSLLHGQGLTIKGAQKVLKEQGVETVIRGEVRIGAPIQEVIDASRFESPAANPVQQLQQTVNDVVESGVFTQTEGKKSDRLSSLLEELDSVKARLDAVLVKDAA
ncbi:MAG: hypothetical protein CMK09_00315 [Ponticaulis sp.]|nr:hypothetical protein [Ponticaulis sp.]|tara:strand:- start:84 stop:593 length:510 start_codon:yes stop_codon:yes gene_type:complete